MAEDGRLARDDDDSASQAMPLTFALSAIIGARASMPEQAAHRSARARRWASASRQLGSHHGTSHQQRRAEIIARVTYHGAVSIVRLAVAVT